MWEPYNFSVLVLSWVVVHHLELSSMSVLQGITNPLIKQQLPVGNWQWIQLFQFALEYSTYKAVSLDVLERVSLLLDGEHKYHRVDRTVVFSFNIPTLEHHCECTYMHTISVLLSDSCATSTKFWHCNSSSKSNMYSSMSTFTSRYIQNTYVYSCTVWPRQAVLHKLFRMNIFSPKNVFFGEGGWSPSLLLSHSTLSPCHFQLIQHTASTCDNTYTVVPPRQKIIKHPTCRSTVSKFNKKKCAGGGWQCLKNCKHSPLYLLKMKSS